MANKSRATANLVSNTGISTFTDLNITRVNVTGVGTISNGSITNLTGTAATITTGNFTTGNIVTGVVTNFTSTNGSITNLTGTSSTITTLRSTTLNADTGNIVTGVTTNFTSTNGSITNLTGTSSTITTLRSTTGNFTTGNIVTGVTTNFNATNVVITGVTTVSAGTTALPSISPSGDPNTGIFFPSADTIAVTSGGTERVKFDNTEVVFNDTGVNYDFRIESDTNANIFFVDASDNSIGMGTFPNSGDGILTIAAFGSGAGTANTRLGMSIYDLTSGRSRGLWFGARTDEDTGVIGTRTATGHLAFETYNGGWGERMRLTYEGRFLVGATSASGTGEIVSVRGVSPNVIIRASSGDPGIRLYDSNDNAVNSCQINYYDNSAFSIEVIPALPMKFLTTNAERMTIAAGGAVNVVGAFSKGSGSFRIDHPLPEKKDTHQLVHSFIEGPQVDLIYRGHVNLIDGKAVIDIDKTSNMTNGTFEVLCRDVCCFTSNETDWIPVRGHVDGNILTIEAQDPTSTAEVCWMVIGERKDQHIMDTDWTDENGRVITEPLK